MNDTPLPPEHPEKESHEQEPTKAEAAAGTAEPRAETRFQHFTRALLRWLVFALVLFAAGVAVIYFTRVQPLQTQLKQVQATQTALQKANTQQQSDLTQLRSDNSILTSANSDLNSMQARDKAHMDLLRALNEVNLARMFLAQNNVAAAKNALNPVKDQLNTIGGFAKDATKVKPIQDRLDLVVSEASTNSQTALSDLGIMNDQLLELEKQLFPAS